MMADEITSISVAFYEGESEMSMLEWHPHNMPHFEIGDVVWLEISVYPVWKLEGPEALELTRFTVTGIQHSLLATYTTDNIMVYKLEVYLERN